ncbi:MAG: polymerase subunit sigma-24 [Bradyrhizobium sp.]|nr:polymerase subunit sigma-24 [Bradyrhizobium sp.]
MTSVSRQDLENIDRRLRSALMAFFTRRVRNRVEAEDLTQEVFIRLARSEGSHIESADAYVFQIAANLLRDKARREKVRTDYREAKRLEDYIDVDPLDPFRIAAGRQDLALLARSLAELPEKTRRIFTLYRIENIDKRVIAESFGLSIRMVEVHIQKALLMLCDRLGGAA